MFGYPTIFSKRNRWHLMKQECAVKQLIQVPASIWAKGTIVLLHPIMNTFVRTEQTTRFTYPLDPEAQWISDKQLLGDSFMLLQGRLKFCQLRSWKTSSMHIEAGDIDTRALLGPCDHHGMPRWAILRKLRIIIFKGVEKHRNMTPALLTNNVIGPRHWLLFYLSSHVAIIVM